MVRVQKKDYLGPGTISKLVYFRKKPATQTPQFTLMWGSLLVDHTTVLIQSLISFNLVFLTQIGGRVPTI